MPVKYRTLPPQLKGNAETVEQMLMTIGRSPYNYQKAIAWVLSTLSFKNRKLRIVAEVPAGHGKSIIMSLLVGILTQIFEQIIVVYPNTDLKNFEAKMIQKLQEMFPHQALHFVSKEDLL